MSQDDIVEIKLGSNSSCKVHKFGATLISWLCDGEEQIFVSAKSHFDKKKAIRGGIPIVFPNFGPWSLGPQHGFARISSWESSGPSQDKDGSPSMTFTLKDSEETRKMWNYKFTLKYVVTLLPTSLTTELTVANDDSQNFDFTCLLHTYVKVQDVTKATVSGFQGLSYVDKVKDGARLTEEREFVTVSENVDRVYEKTPSDHTVTGAAGGRKILINKENLPDTVVWNPWSDKARGMSDFGDNEYPSMLCVEAGYVSERKVLGVGETYMAKQTLTRV